MHNFKWQSTIISQNSVSFWFSTSQPSSHSSARIKCMDKVINFHEPCGIRFGNKRSQNQGSQMRFGQTNPYTRSMLDA